MPGCWRQYGGSPFEFLYFRTSKIFSRSDQTFYVQGETQITSIDSVGIDFSHIISLGRSLNTACGHPKKKKRIEPLS